MAVIAALGFFLGPWILIILLLVRTKRLRSSLEELRRTVSALGAAGKAADEATASSADDAQATGTPSVEPAEASGDGEHWAADEEDASFAPQPTAALRSPKPEDLEQRLASHWLVWLGGVTVALGSAFLIKHSFEAGWLSPSIRVIAGLVFAALMIGLGEWLRRQPLSQSIAAVRPDDVPPALTGGGLFAAFASLYGAEALYGLLSPIVTFAGLGAVAFLAVGLSLLQGPFIALLGLVGGFATPWLLASDDPVLWPLVAYLLSLIGAGLFVVRYQAWPWLAYAVLCGAIIWALPLLALLRGGQVGQSPAVATYLIAIAALVILVLDQGAPTSAPRQVQPDKRTPGWAWLASLAPVDRFRALSASLVALLVFGLARADSYGTASLVALFVFAAGYLIACRWRQQLVPLPVTALMVVVATLAVWHIPQDLLPWPAPLYQIEGEAFGIEPGPILSPAVTPFLMISAAFAALFGLGGFFALWGARQPGLWAGLSAAGPVLLLSIAYWRIEAFAINIRWAVAAFILAGLGVIAASIVERYRHLPGANLALGIYAAGTVAALSLAGTMVLEQAWLTVAIALQLPALAWLSRHLDLPAFRPVAAVIAVIVLIRLVLNPSILDYPTGSVPGVSWVLYGYGIPAIACYLAARWFRAGGTDRLVRMLEAEMLLFGILLVNLQIRFLIAGSLAAPTYGLLEQSLNAITWLSVASVLMWTDAHRSKVQMAGTPSPVGSILSQSVLYWGWRILLGMGAAQVLLLQLLLKNPLWSPTPVGALPVINLLLLAYGVPTLLACGFALIWPEDRNRAFWSKISWVAALVLGMVYLSFELRHYFQGTRLDGPTTTDAEIYSYSVLWLTVAATLLSVGLWSANRPLRHAALIIVLTTVAKVFLIDAAALPGLYRVASFLGLGLALIGIGYLYQRFLASVPREQGEEAPS